MFKFKNHNAVPPKGYNFKSPSGFNVNTRSYDQWIFAINEHHRANGLPEVSKEEAEDHNCRSLSPSAATEFCRDEEAENCIEAVTLKAADIMRGTLALTKFKLLGSPLVNHQEAERRAAICVACPYNVNFRKPCGGLCPDLISLISNIVGGAHTSQDDKLNACAVCRCSLPAKIHIPLDVLDKIDGNSYEYPENCWINH